MQTNPWIDASRRAYARLLRFYPRDHRAEYGPHMLQVFGDQCRAAYASQRAWGVLALWLRTLPDLVISNLREQFTSPNFTDGLLEPVSGSPLPWKGVLLVLLPGLVFLVSQVAQLNGQDWFFTVLYRGAYFLILPVLLVWLLTRKFPVWGLIPLGMLYRTVWSFIFSNLLTGYFTLHLSLAALKFHYLYYYLSNAFRIVNRAIQPLNNFLQKNLYWTNGIATLLLLGLLVALVLIVWRTGRFSRAGWIWLGLTLAISLTGILLQVPSYLQASVGVAWTSVISKFLQVMSWEFQDLSQVLIIILAGTLLIKRYGSLALLLPLGYMIPFVLIGRVTPAGSLIPFFFIGIGVLVYRIILTLIAPVWILRSASPGWQTRAFGVALLAALLISVTLNTLFSFYYVIGQATTDMSIFFFSISTALLDAAAIGLALALYRSTAAALRPGPSSDLQPAGSLP